MCVAPQNLPTEEVNIVNELVLFESVHFCCLGAHEFSSALPNSCAVCDQACFGAVFMIF